VSPWHASYGYHNFEETPAAAAAVLRPTSYRYVQEIKVARTATRPGRCRCRRARSRSANR
jgi:hypothetical protein